MEKEQILVANTVRENLNHWDESVVSHVESITGEYLYDANRRIPGGVDFVGVSIEFKEGVSGDTREKIQELVESALADNVSESTERAAYRGGVLVDRTQLESEDQKQVQRKRVLEYLKSDCEGMVRQIEHMKSPTYLPSPPKIITNGEIVSLFPIADPENQKTGVDKTPIGGVEHAQKVLVGVEANHKAYMATLSHKEAESLGIGSRVEVRRGMDGKFNFRSLDNDLALKKGMER